MATKKSQKAGQVISDTKHYSRSKCKTESRTTVAEEMTICHQEM